MKRQKRAAVDIGRKGFLRGGVRLDQFLMMLEDRFDDFIDKLVRQVVVDHGKNINAESMIIRGKEGYVPAGTRDGEISGKSRLTRTI